MVHIKKKKNLKKKELLEIKKHNSRKEKFNRI